MKKIFLTTSPTQTKNFGKNFGEKLLKGRPSKKAKVIGLEGDLGGGKTTFLQGFAKGVGIKEKILSPTFVIMKSFQLSAFSFQRFYHIDCYRIEKPKELLDLGFREIISDPKNIVTVEWADRVRKIIPKDALWIKFEFVNGRTRKITIKTKNQRLKIKNTHYSYTN